MAKKDNYSIKGNYIIRAIVEDFDDTGFKDEWQNEVYQWAHEVVILNEINKIIDVGVGSGYKLFKYFSELNIIGIDSAATVAHLESKYPETQWLDFMRVNYSLLSTQMVICADVIEHVENPEKLLMNIKSIRNIAFLLISTPERDVKWGEDHVGPPPNKFHVREWNSQEFKQLVSNHFDIIEHRITNQVQGTQAILCQPRY